MGCYLELNGAFGNYSMLVPRDDERSSHQDRIMPPLGELTYSVYDWEEDGSIGSIAIPVQHVSRNIPGGVTTGKICHIQHSLV